MPKRTYAALSFESKGAKRPMLSKPKFLAPMRQRITKYFVPGSGVEVKYLDSTINFALNNSGTGTPAALLLNSLAGGTDDNERIGRKITVNSIQIAYRIAGSNSDLGSGNFPENSDTARVVIVHDKQPNGVGITYPDVYNIVGGAGPTDPMAFRQMDQSSRFSILSDNRHTVCLNGPNGIDNSRYIKCKLPVRYQGSGSGIANITTGAIWLLAVDANGTASNNITLNGYARVTYTDD